MHIREARVEDADAMSRVLIASITALCQRDHAGVRAYLDQWLANKSPSGVRAWFASGKSRLLIAERDAEVVGLRAATLTSTATAHAFYLARGWRDAGPPQSRFAVLVHPMTKALP